MIAADDRVSLPPGVELRGRTLVDSVRGVELPLNECAVLVLMRANGASVASLGAALAAAGACDGLQDALSFCSALNARYLLNVEIGLVPRAGRRLRALAYGIVVHVPPRRVSAGSLHEVVRAVAPAGATVAGLLAPLALLGGVWTLAAALATGAGIVLHELGHALALRGVPSAVVLHGLRPTLLHPRLGFVRTVAVATAGPLLPALAALCASLAWEPLALATAPVGAHALALTVFSPDGRNACGLS